MVQRKRVQYTLNNTISGIQRAQGKKVGRCPFVLAVACVAKNS